MKNTENQVTNMKKQTIGVEVEMNSITRKKQQFWLENILVQEHTMQQENTVISVGLAKTRKEEHGNSKRMYQLQDQTMKNAKW